MMSSKLALTAMLLTLGLPHAAGQDAPIASMLPRGVMVDLGGHRLHVDCIGEGLPTIIIENGFEEFSFDWIFVQSALAKSNKVCIYDRAGYAWSDPGPKPRTFAQINLELHDALAKLGEHGPFVLVGHMFGGPIVRNYAQTYPDDVAGLVFVDAVSEDQRFEMWNKAVLMREGARGKAVPTPRENMLPADKVEVATYYKPGTITAIAYPFNLLPSDTQKLHLWAQSQRSLAAAEENEREWSPEYFARWHADRDANKLGSVPLIVLTRANGGFHDLDIPAAQQEAERKQAQSRLAGLSKKGEQRTIASGEHMEVEDPDAVVQAVHEISAGRMSP